jgi:hypothetical protein
MKRVVGRKSEAASNEAGSEVMKQVVGRKSEAAEGASQEFGLCGDRTQDPQKHSSIGLARPVYI